MTVYTFDRRWRRAAGARALGAIVAVLALGGCDPDEVLTVPDPDVVPAGRLRTREGLPVVRASTLANFQIAYSGGADLQNNGHEGQINMVGLFTDEFLHAETFTDRQNVDMRNILPGNATMSLLFLDLSRARAFADFASARYNEFAQSADDSLAHAQTLNVGAYTYILFAENYCSGVPFSVLNDDNSITFGTPLTREQTLERAVAKFDSALARAEPAEDAEQLALARIGKARALLDVGRFAEAAAAIGGEEGVPTDFSVVVQHSANSERQKNGIWNYTVNVNAFSVPDADGANGLPFASAGDPRAPAEDLGIPGFDGETPFTLQLKYQTPTDEAPLATGVEARLIEAEAALQAGQPDQWLAALNELRATGLGGPLDALADPGSDAARVDLHFRERAFWLYLTAHRLGDLRRLVRQYSRDPESVFPSGSYFKGGEYGTDVNFPISGTERNNPNFQQCLDRAA